MRRIITSVLLLFVAIAADCAAQRMTTAKFSAEKCSIGLPKGWRRVTEQEKKMRKEHAHVLLAGEKLVGGDSLAVMLMVLDDPALARLRGPEAISVLNESLGVKDDDSSVSTTRLAGVYAVASPMTTPFHARRIAAFANDRIYQIWFVANHQALFDDPDFERILSSFAFIGAPKLAGTAPEATSSASGDLRFTSEGISVRVPAGWERDPEREGEGEVMTSLLGARRIDGNDSLGTVLMVRSMPEKVDLHDPDLKRGMEQSIAEGGSFKLDTTIYTTLGGHEALDLRGRLTAGGVMRTLITFTNDRMYMVTLVANDPKLLDGPDARGLIAGVGFFAPSNNGSAPSRKQ